MDDVRITEMSISLRRGEPLKAFVSLTLNDNLVIRGIRILRRKQGDHVAMPRCRTSSGFSDVVEPLSKRTWAAIEELVLAAFHDAENGDDPDGAPPCAARMRPERPMLVEVVETLRWA